MSLVHNFLKKHPKHEEIIAKELRNAGFFVSVSSNVVPEFREFERLNQRYTDKFGFPFILAVRGLERTEILKVFRLRVENGVEDEFDEAIRQVFKIARLRLSQIKAV